MTDLVAAPASNTLSSILSAKASIALPEIVSVFLNKYETDLYALKDGLSSTIAAIRDEISTHEQIVIAKAKFSQYEGLTIPKLFITTKLSDDIGVSWEKARVKGYIKIMAAQDADSRPERQFSKAVYSPINKADITKHEKIFVELHEHTHELTKVLSQLGDMTRKERQIKARISELRLEEQGLTDFLSDDKIMALISPNGV